LLCLQLRQFFTCVVTSKAEAVTEPSAVAPDPRVADYYPADGLAQKSAKPNKSEPEAVATGSPVIYEGDG
jgi:hypothetical protein